MAYSDMGVGNKNEYHGVLNEQALTVHALCARCVYMSKNTNINNSCFSPWESHNLKRIKVL